MGKITLNCPVTNKKFTGKLDPNPNNPVVWDYETESHYIAVLNTGALFWKNKNSIARDGERIYYHN